MHHVPEVTELLHSCKVKRLEHKPLLGSLKDSFFDFLLIREQESNLFTLS